MLGLHRWSSVSSGTRWQINADVQVSLVTLEGAVLRPEKDHQEKVSDTIRKALLLNILPKTVQSRVYEHLDMLTTHEIVRENVISLVHVSQGPTGMDCSSVNVDTGEGEQWSYEDEWWPEEEEIDVGAVVTSETECVRCLRKGSPLDHVGRAGGEGKRKGKWGNIREREGV